MSNAKQGYTLLELMIVVVLMALISALAAPQMSEGLHNQAESDAANEIAVVFRAARGLAAGSGVAHRIRVVFGGAPAGQAVVVDRGNAASCINGGVVDFPAGCNITPPAFGGAGCGVKAMVFNHGYFISHRTQLRSFALNGATLGAGTYQFCVTPRGRMVQITGLATTQPLTGSIEVRLGRKTSAGLWTGVDRYIGVTSQSISRVY